MTRVREEAAGHGTREGTLVALVDTGGVVTGAGLILAGTFATLTLLPLEELIQIGATVAIGVLLDTFIVRALLIPAITYRLGERAWWPSRAGAGAPTPAPSLSSRGCALSSCARSCGRRPSSPASRRRGRCRRRGGRSARG